MSGALVVVFGGTRDGRLLAQRLAGGGITTLLCVATEYGAQVVPSTKGLRVRVGRLHSGEIAALIRESGCRAVVDATHPYADMATANIKKACAARGMRYLRMLRPRWEAEDGVVDVDSAGAAAAFLAAQEGRALLTVGSKELEAFAAVPQCAGRLVARVLPTPQVLEKCAALGFAGKALIAMEGPFSRELNVATIRQCGVSWLVTKDSGEVGGFYEKLAAVRETGISMVLIRRPMDGEGLDRAALERLLLEEYAPGGAAAPAVGEIEEVAKPCPRFPLFIDLTGKLAVLVGGGAVATRRVATLRRCGARIRVVAPEGSRALEQLAEGEAVQWLRRPYRPGDLAGAAVAVAAADDPAVNRRVCDEAAGLGIPHSAADDSRAGSFWFPALIHEGNLSVGLVSTDGDHGAVRRAAATIRESLGDRE